MRKITKSKVTQGWAVVVFTFNPSIGEAETGQSLRPASLQSPREPRLQRKMLSGKKCKTDNEQCRAWVVLLSKQT